MRNWWLSVGCFLTGFNYHILKSCSELSVKRVIKYTSALLIVCFLWGFIGFAFTERYLKGGWYTNFLAALFMVFLIIQIERQIILSGSEQRGLHRFRLVIGISMALIGTVIIDQIIFIDDIEKRKMFTIDEEVKKILPGRAMELHRQLDEIDSMIQAKEVERKLLTDDLFKNPFVTTYETEVKVDTSRNPVITRIRKQVSNPKDKLLAPLDKSIADMRSDKMEKDNKLLSLSPIIEDELKKHVGLLDELEVMYSLLSESLLSFIAWAIWFVFLLGLELFILVSKWGESETDYDRRMKQQMELHFKRIDLLGKQTESVV